MYSKIRGLGEVAVELHLVYQGSTWILGSASKTGKWVNNKAFPPRILNIVGLVNVIYFASETRQDQG
jgi:hypothetical protein